MNGSSVAALMLASALAVLPLSPRRRLVTAVGAARRRWSLRWAAWLVAACMVVLAVVLPLTTALAVAVVGSTAILRYRRRRRRERGTAEAQALEAALDVLVGELRVGAHPVRAFSVAANETAGVVAESMRAVAARAQLGADVAGGLREAARLSALSAPWQRLAVYWELATQHGLAIARLMRAAQRDIVERQRFSEGVRSGLAGARATANILAGLPVLGVLLGELIGAQPLRFLFNGYAGGWLLVVGVVLACGGLMWADQITDRVAA
ncbi:type II secretion system F family protein [Mycobacterium simiae]|uniref:type II secretion system F family protein n=1 Tax=Mycobacterium simiae TaxID=1784 RepID=UPI00165F1230|nr:type II secretion system F family protein [Mycobacterium simiae]